MARLYIALGFFAFVGLFAYVAFAPTVPVWVRQLFHVAIGLVIIAVIAGAGWAIVEFSNRVA